MFEIEALQNTFLKHSTAQAITLPDSDKHAVFKGRKYPVETYSEIEDEHARNDGDGHVLVTLGHKAGTWYIWPEHWHLPWHNVSKNMPETVIALPEWDSINWDGRWSEPVSKYFVLGEVCNWSDERRPQIEDVKRNVVAIARAMDAVREWWDGPLGVNSWYRPWHVNRRIGSRAANHPSGSAVDFRPLNGSVFELQKRFKAEWYDTGKWAGGFGMGAKKGFVHLDLRGRRMWPY